MASQASTLWPHSKVFALISFPYWSLDFLCPNGLALHRNGLAQHRNEHWLRSCEDHAPASELRNSNEPWWVPQETLCFGDWFHIYAGYSNSCGSYLDGHRPSYYLEGLKVCDDIYFCDVLRLELALFDVPWPWKRDWYHLKACTRPNKFVTSRCQIIERLPLFFLYLVAQNLNLKVSII